MPMPRPISSQFDRSLFLEAIRRGNQASGTVSCRPSSRSMMSVSSLKLTLRARPLSVSRPGAPALSSDVLMPCLLHHRTSRGHDLKHNANLPRAAIMRLGERDRWSKPDLRVCVAGPRVLGTSLRHVSPKHERRQWPQSYVVGPLGTAS